ncbi:MAG: A24 family peptidase, partial [Coriobacteriia bacterium]|nr:A24 family peptidase [Coriobacteriia bacterium]
IVSGLMLLTEIIRPESIGGGDIKMMVAAGLLLGIQNVLIAALIGICSAGLYAAGLLIVKKASMGEKFAYGPFLCLGVWAAHLFGAEIVSFLF